LSKAGKFSFLKPKPMLTILAILWAVGAATAAAIDFYITRRLPRHWGDWLALVCIGVCWPVILLIIALAWLFDPETWRRKT
jgi:drug/metabolite transporter (DMT)-like permease